MQGRNPIIFDWFVCHGWAADNLSVDFMRPLLDIDVMIIHRRRALWSGAAHYRAKVRKTSKGDISVANKIVSDDRLFLLE
jgi:hypothetical protein